MADADKYVVGFDEGSGAWRHPIGQPLLKEAAWQTFAPRGAQLMDHPLAIFSDGTTMEVKTMTCEDIAGNVEPIVSHPPLMKRARGKKDERQTKDIWTGKASETGLALKVCWRKDREPHPWLLSLFVATSGKGDWKQICQIDVMAFGTAHDTADKFIGLGERFCAGKVDIDQLY